MSGANYAHCDHCNTKAFYDAETDIGDAAVFHGRCLPEHDRAVRAGAIREVARAVDFPLSPPPPPTWPEVAARLRRVADRIEREAGESDADA